ncbi:MAG: histidine--tRNA ligase [Acidobacteria bacterium]|nr:histidine--tRNA ligase [Acidobacteriota bacterium]
MFRVVKGTRDILPEEVEDWQRAEGVAREVFARYGFREIRTPILEATELFRTGLGEDTDVVAKEMYTFLDRRGRSLTLRPENTAPVVRAFLEHDRVRRAGLDRIYYVGPMFRYEQPQKGRFRQFHQIGVEVFGSSDAAVDAETTGMALVYLERLGLEGCTLWLNSVGDERCRPGYREALLGALRDRAGDLCGNCRERYRRNPLRILDCKEVSCRAILREGPFLVDHLCGDCREHFDRVQSHLAAMDVPFRVNPRIVRGLDYYTRTTFEVTAAGLGAQDALLGGGRYDRLVERFGGPAVPGFGFAIGLDRVVLVLGCGRSGGRPPEPGLYLIATGTGGPEWALRAGRELRGRGLAVEVDFGPGSLKAKMRRADRSARSHVLIREEGIGRGIRVRRLVDGRQVEVPEGAWEEIVREVSIGAGN